MHLVARRLFVNEPEFGSRHGKVSELFVNDMVLNPAVLPVLPGKQCGH